MTKRRNSLFSRVLRLERGAREVHPMRSIGRGKLSTYQKTLAIHIASTTQSAGRGLAR